MKTCVPMTRMSRSANAQATRQFIRRIGRKNPGPTVLYRNRAGNVVADMLMTKAHDGLRVAGLNHRLHDREPGQVENLVAVFIAAYQPQAAGPALPVAVAKR